MPKKGCYEDLTGKRFGRLVALSYAGQGNRRRTYWLCKCDCGKTTKVQSIHLKSGHTTSCGCRLEEIHKEIANVNYKNGLSKTRLYLTYKNMINRCYRKNGKFYKDYGGRGITVCDEWKNDFQSFYDWAYANGYDENAEFGKCTIDRIDNNGNYEPNNCRWVDNYVQANNKRKNLKLKINGEIDNISNWSKRLNLSYWNLRNYSKGKANCAYPNLKIEVVNE